jgi:hypothetical protein
MNKSQYDDSGMLYISDRVGVLQRILKSVSECTGPSFTLSNTECDAIREFTCDTLTEVIQHELASPGTISTKRTAATHPLVGHLATKWSEMASKLGELLQDAEPYAKRDLEESIQARGFPSRESAIDVPGRRLHSKFKSYWDSAGAGIFRQDRLTGHIADGLHLFDPEPYSKFSEEEDAGRAYVQNLLEMNKRLRPVIPT